MDLKKLSKVKDSEETKEFKFVVYNKNGEELERFETREDAEDFASVFDESEVEIKEETEGSHVEDAKLSAQGEVEAKKLFEANGDVFTAWSQFKPNNTDGIIASDEGEGFDENNPRTDFKTGTAPLDLAKFCVWLGITDRDEIITYASYYLGDGWFK